MTDFTNSTNPPSREPFRRCPLPNPLPEWEYLRAFWIGYEAARWFPFDARYFLERAALVGVSVCLGNDGVVGYGVGGAVDQLEWEFLNGWHQGSPGAVNSVAHTLEHDKQVRNAHLHLARMPRPA